MARYLARIQKDVDCNTAVQDIDDAGGLSPHWDSEKEGVIFGGDDSIRKAVDMLSIITSIEEIPANEEPAHGMFLSLR